MSQTLQRTVRTTTASRRSSLRRRSRQWWLLTLVYLISAAILLLQFFPLIWALLTSLMTVKETTTVPATLFPAHPTVLSYIDALRNEIGRYYLNSCIVAVVSTLLTLIISTPAAYAFARLHFRLKSAALIFVLFFSLFPPLVQLIPLYQILQSLHFLNTLQGLILPYAVFGLPLATLILIAFFQDIPIELEEAAIVDGLSRFGSFVRIILPISLPGLLATAIIVFVSDWNEYLFALNYTSTNTYTLPVGIVTISQTEFTTNFGLLSAATILSIVPIIVFILLLERRIVTGLTAGSLKG